MRRTLAAAALALAACAPRGQPYRFASPMIGGADVPLPALPGAAPPAHRATIGIATAAAPSHTTSARGVVGIEAAPPPIASAAAADAVPHTGVVYSRLPAPNRVPADEPLPAIHDPIDLRALVGRRTKADPFELAIGWETALGHHVPLPPEISARQTRSEAARSTAAGRAITHAAAVADDVALAGLPGAQLLAWARDAGALHDLDTPPDPGDLLVFDEIESGADADLVAVVVARDARGVTELVYASGGVIRRGFVDANRPALRRDHDGLIVNTFMRTGRRWPPKGTHYLAGELLSHVLRPR